MTKEEKQFIENQLNIIENKIDEDMLNRYATLLSVSNISKEVRGFLTRAIDRKREELNPSNHMVVGAEFD